MQGPHSYGGWGGKRTEVEFVLDGRNNGLDSAAWYLHNVHKTRQGRGGSGCGCGGGGCARCCWTPATAWFDYGRAYVSYWRDIFDCLYGRSGCGPSHCEPACPPPCPPPCPPDDCHEKIVVSDVKPGSIIEKTFQVVNPTSDRVEIDFTVEGFVDRETSAKWVMVKPEKAILGAGEKVTLHAVVDLQRAHVRPGKYEGKIVARAPMPNFLVVEVQVSSS